ncbi:outer membrane lipoprotein carrier protein LolA [Streptomyces coeruleoprunus]|uniref:Outer membrane lipoprotein carrier protein LolA n=1 Tax=Streptomyces coeruleoprunus TaxID=285563 RepID=A0ABV9XKF0_9ACTN
MAPNDSAQTERPVRGRAARYAVPVAVAGVAAATIGLVPALAASGDPDLPKITAQQLIEKMAASDVEQMSGTLKVSTDLGLPSLAGLSDLAGGAGGDGGSDAAASAEQKLMELASGTHTLRVAADGPDKQRLTVVDGSDEFSVIHNGKDAWTYDSKAGEVVHSKDADGGPGAEGPDDIPALPKDFAAQALKAVDPTTSVTVDGTARVAGRDAYQLVIKPKQSGSTIGSIKVAVDAQNGVPLKFTLTPSSGGKAVVDAGFTKVDFAKPAASTFDFTPPKGAKVTEEDGPDGLGGPHASPKGPEGEDLKGPKAPEGLEDLDAMEGFPGLNVIGEGWTTVVELGGAGEPGTAPGTPSGKAPAKGEEEMPADAQKFLDSLGDKVTGTFGSGTVFKTRLVNALMTDDGKVYVGAVTEKALLDAANKAAK